MCVFVCALVDDDKQTNDENEEIQRFNDMATRSRTTEAVETDEFKLKPPPGFAPGPSFNPTCVVGNLGKAQPSANQQTVLEEATI